MKRKTFPKKLVLNKTTIAKLNSLEQDEINGGISLQLLTDDECVYTEGCTGWGCTQPHDPVNTCIYTNYGDMAGCPITMTLCGELMCP
jgi:hypothetical protein